MVGMKKSWETLTNSLFMKETCLLNKVGKGRFFEGNRDVKRSSS